MCGVQLSLDTYLSQKLNFALHFGAELMFMRFSPLHPTDSDHFLRSHIAVCEHMETVNIHRRVETCEMWAKIQVKALREDKSNSNRFSLGIVVCSICIPP